MMCVPLDEFVVVHGAAQLQHAPRTHRRDMQSERGRDYAALPPVACLSCLCALTRLVVSVCGV
jgi:hypothetical protein